MPRSTEKKARLSLRWSKKENDALIKWDAGIPKADCWLLFQALCGDDIRFKTDGTCTVGPSFVKALKDRGYDITTIRFSVDKVLTATEKSLYSGHEQQHRPHRRERLDLRAGRPGP